MSFFIREASADDLNRLRKSLTEWGTKKVGNLETKLGEKVEITSCKCCDVYSLSLDTLIEKRESKVVIKPSKKDQLATSPRVAHGSINIWSTPTPTGFKNSFVETFHIDTISGTEYYVPCKDCNEKGHNDCPSCNKSGKEKCGACHATKRVDCSSCNGYGFFDCANCNHTGQVNVDCSVCHKGYVNCNACGGDGHFRNSQGNKIECRACNGTGDDVCGACGGRGFDTVRCNQCNSGEIPCKTCRTQKTVPCTACDPNGLIPCSTCLGKTLVDCVPCKTLGGFKHSENLNYTTHIEQNEVFLSPLESIKKDHFLDYKEKQEYLSDQFSMADIQEKIPFPELHPTLTELQSHVQSSRPPATLKERLVYGKDSVLDVHFKYEGQEGHAYYYLNFGSLVVTKDPLSNKHKKSSDELTASFKKAKATHNFAEAQKIIARAEELKLGSLAKTWKAEIEALKEKLRKEEVDRFIHKVKRPTLIAVPLGFWLVGGFLTSLSITILLIFAFLAFGAYQNTSKDNKLEIAQHKKDLHKQVKRLAMIYGISIAVIFGLNYYSAQKDTEQFFRRGILLQGQK